MTKLDEFHISDAVRWYAKLLTERNMALEDSTVNQELMHKKEGKVMYAKFRMDLSMKCCSPAERQAVLDAVCEERNYVEDILMSNKDVVRDCLNVLDFDSDEIPKYSVEDLIHDVDTEDNALAHLLNSYYHIIDSITSTYSITPTLHLDTPES